MVVSSMFWGVDLVSPDGAPDRARRRRRQPGCDQQSLERRKGSSFLFLAKSGLCRAQAPSQRFERSLFQATRPAWTRALMQSAPLLLAAVERLLCRTGDEDLARLGFPI